MVVEENIEITPHENIVLLDPVHNFLATETGEGKHCKRFRFRGRVFDQPLIIPPNYFRQLFNLIAFVQEFRIF